LLNPDIYKTDPKQAHEWQLRVNEIDTLLLDKLARWDELESRAS
jgi:ATP-binding cassette subfamily F protein uup